MATIRSRKIDFLKAHGFTYKEAKAFTDPYIITEGRRVERKPYSMKDLHTLPYFKNMIRSRQLYIGKLKKKGLSDRKIQEAVNALYKKQRLTTDKTSKGEPGPWAMLRKYRALAIESGDYVPPTHKGSHHKTGVSKEDLATQQKRNAEKSYQRDSERLDYINRVLNKEVKLSNPLTIDEYEELVDEQRKLQVRLNKR